MTTDEPDIHEAMRVIEADPEFQRRAAQVNHLLALGAITTTEQVAVLLGISEQLVAAFIARDIARLTGEPQVVLEVLAPPPGVTRH